MMEMVSQNNEMNESSSYERNNNMGQRLSLSDFPDELILLIFSYLDVDDLLIASRLTHHLRTLSHDPLLHTHRLHHASLSLSHHLTHRLPLTTLLSQRIYITRTSLAARSLGRNLIKIKLNRQLGLRPSVETLVEKGVLPGECYGRGMAPGLVGVKRKIERERVKDGLRRWVEGWRGRVGEKEREIEIEMERERSEREGYAKVEVRWLVRRWACRSSTGGGNGREEWENNNVRRRWGRKMDCREREDPARAKVLGLRRFWERVGREGDGSLVGVGGIGNL